MTDLLFTLTDEAPALELARRELAKAEESGVGYAEAAAKVAELERAVLAERRGHAEYYLDANHNKQWRWKEGK